MPQTNGQIDDEERAKAAEIAARVLTDGKGEPLDDLHVVCRQLLRALKRDASNRHLVDGNEDLQRLEARGRASRELAKRRGLI